MAEKPPSKADQVAALRLARANRKYNPFEDAARGRDPEPSRPAQKILDGLKEALAVAKSEIKPAKVTVFKRGRPLAKDAHKTLAKTKPWEAEGMSKATWYRRKAKAEKGEA